MHLTLLLLNLLFAISEVQDILGGLNDFHAPSTFPQQQPALPPKQRPSSAQQREKISKALKPLPRPPSRILRQESNQRLSPVHGINSTTR